VLLGIGLLTAVAAVPLEAIAVLPEAFAGDLAILASHCVSCVCLLYHNVIIQQALAVVKQKERYRDRVLPLYF